MRTREFPRSQKIGAAWTIVYALLTGFGPTAFRNSDVESVLILMVLPIACLIAVFAYFRNGGYLAFGTLRVGDADLVHSLWSGRAPAGFSHAVLHARVACRRSVGLRLESVAGVSRETESASDRASVAAGGARPLAAERRQPR